MVSERTRVQSQSWVDQLQLEWNYLHRITCSHMNFNRVAARWVGYGILRHEREVACVWIEGAAWRRTEIYRTL